DPAREDEEIAALMGKQVDGLLIASAHNQKDKEAWKILTNSGVPCVLVDRPFPSIPFIGTDNEQLGVLATRHLIEQGYRSIGFFGMRSVTTSFARWRGYVHAMRDAGLRVQRNYSADVYGVAGGCAAIHQLLRTNPRADAIFAASESTALGVMQGL